MLEYFEQGRAASRLTEQDADVHNTQSARGALLRSTALRVYHGMASKWQLPAKPEIAAGLLYVSVCVVFMHPFLPAFVQHISAHDLRSHGRMKQN